MADDQYGPPPGLSEEERRRWQQWRKFVWGPGDIVITKRPGVRSPKRTLTGAVATGGRGTQGRVEPGLPRRGRGRS